MPRAGPSLPTHRAQGGGPPLLWPLPRLPTLLQGGCLPPSEARAFGGQGPCCHWPCTPAGEAGIWSRAFRLPVPHCHTGAALSRFLGVMARSGADARGARPGPAQGKLPHSSPTPGPASVLGCRRPGFWDPLTRRAGRSPLGPGRAGSWGPGPAGHCPRPSADTPRLILRGVGGHPDGASPCGPQRPVLSQVCEGSRAPPCGRPQPLLQRLPGPAQRARSLCGKKTFRPQGFARQRTVTQTMAGWLRGVAETWPWASWEPLSASAEWASEGPEGWLWQPWAGGPSSRGWLRGPEPLRRSGALGCSWAAR